MRAFPDAKVLLSVRDPEEWYESTITTIYSMYKIRRYLTHGPGSGPGAGVFGPTRSPATSRTARCNRGLRERHNEEVVRHVPPERLLVYEAKEGGDRLCQFLDVGVPEGLPFPRLNGYATIWNLPDKKEQASETQQGRRDSATGSTSASGRKAASSQTGRWCSFGTGCRNRHRVPLLWT